MRIIAGKYKGRRLVSFKASHIRPTTDRVKESIFNTIQNELYDEQVLDLFSGTGNMAIEAFSRGACAVVAVESHTKSIDIIKENLKALDIKEGIKIIKKDVFKFISSYEGEPFRVIIVDPPFTKKISHDVMAALSISKLYSKDTLVLIESSSHERIDDKYSDLEQVAQKDFGDKKVSYYRYS